jgi:hypothetical protein
MLATNLSGFLRGGIAARASRLIAFTDATRPIRGNAADVLIARNLVQVFGHSHSRDICNRPSVSFAYVPRGFRLCQAFGTSSA